jgi:hypothetical protein
VTTVEAVATPPSRQSARIRALASRPGAWHVATLVVSAIVLAVAARHQWFFFDEWAFLAPSNNSLLFAPHVGHWSTSPVLITHALRAIFGLNTYWPYLAVSMAVHVAICHLLWRIMLRVGTNAWIATALAFLMLLFGAGAENILWEFQIGFMGAMLLGLVVILLLDVETLTRGRWVAIILLSVWSLTFSGTAVPLVLAGVLVNLRRRGWRTTVALFAPATVIYLAWYAIFNRNQDGYFGPHGLGGLLIDVPQYLGHEFVDGLGTIFPFAGFGAIATFCLIVWAVLTFGNWRGPATAAYALAVAGIAQATLTALTREGLGVAAADSGRYVYALFALLLPAVGLCLTWFSRGRVPVVAILSVLVLLTTVYNAGVLLRAADTQAAIEQSTRERVYAGLALEDADSGRYNAALVPAPIYAPGVTLGTLAAMQRDGWIHVGSYDTGAVLSVKANIAVTLKAHVSAPTSARCLAVARSTTTSVTDGAGDIYIYSAQATKASLYLSKGTVIGDTRPLSLAKGWTRINSDTGDRLNIRTTSEAIRFCGA